MPIITLNITELYTSAILPRENKGFFIMTSKAGNIGLGKMLRLELITVILLYNSIAKEDAVERDYIRYDLSFGKSKESDMYFLN